MIILHWTGDVVGGDGGGGVEGRRVGRWGLEAVAVVGYGNVPITPTHGVFINRGSIPKRVYCKSHPHSWGACGPSNPLASLGGFAPPEAPALNIMEYQPCRT